MICSLITLVLALPPTMPVADIRHGQTGTCYTVFEGDTIEPFTFEVKGVMPHFLGPRKDLILVRLTSPKAEFTGVVAGMSGSPCSIDGKVIGALSYAFASFAKEAIAGITPIDSMLEVLNLPDEARPWRLAAAPPGAGSATATTAGLQPATEADWDALRQGRVQSTAADAAATVQLDEGVAGKLQPIATPLTLGGVPPETAEQFMPWLRQAGFAPVVGGAGSSDGKVAQRLRPGGSVSGVLIQGDMDVAGTGTVSWVDGDRVLAFGHPFFGVGPVSIPMANAFIINTMASAKRSFKMSTTGAIVGEITQDRLTAIGGQMGRHPKRVEVKGGIRTLRGQMPFAMSVARDQGMTPRLLAMGISGALAGRADAGQRGMIRVDSVLRVAGQPPVQLHNLYAAERDQGLFGSVGIDVARAFAALWDTPFGPPPDIGVEVNAAFAPEPITETIEAIYTDRAQAEVGAPLEVAVRLRRQGAPVEIARFAMDIPRSWAGHKVALVATGAGGAQRLEREINGVPRPQAFGQIVRYLQGIRPEGQVYLFAIRTGVGLHAATEAYSFVPPSSVALLSGDPSKESRNQGIAWEDRKARPGVVEGLARTAVRVRSF